MVALPTASAAMSPVAFTAATATLPDVHTTLRPVSTLPCASRNVAAACVVWPTEMIGLPGTTTTEATGSSVTVSTALPVTPSTVARMVTGPPTATPATTPAVVTVAIAGLAVVHTIVRSVMAIPAALLTVATSARVLPTTTLPLAGFTTTVATTPRTVRAIEPLTVGLAGSRAEMVAPPALTPVTRPFVSTTATAAFDVDHVSARPLSELPRESRTVAVTWALCPSSITAFAMVSPMLTMGCGMTTTAAALDTEPARATTCTGPPTVTPVTVPAAETDATAGLFDSHVAVRLEQLVWANVALSRSVSPTATLATLGATTTDVTAHVGAAAWPPQAATTAVAATIVAMRATIRRPAACVRVRNRSKAVGERPAFVMVHS